MNVIACISEINDTHRQPGGVGLYATATNHKDVDLK